MAVAERTQILNVLNALVTKGITDKYGKIHGEGRRILNNVFTNHAPGWSNLFYSDNTGSPIDSPQLPINLWAVENEERKLDPYEWGYFKDNQRTHEITEELLTRFAKIFNVEDAITDNSVILDDDDDFVV